MARGGTGVTLETRGRVVERHEDRVLRYAAILFVAAFLIHNADHIRRGLDAVTTEVLWAGTATGIVTVAAIALALAGHRLAPPIAVAAGFAMAFGVAAVHLLPRWSAFSDAFPGGAVDALSWAAVLIEIAGASAFGVAGMYALRRGGASLRERS